MNKRSVWLGTWAARHRLGPMEFGAWLGLLSLITLAVSGQAQFRQRVGPTSPSPTVTPGCAGSLDLDFDAGEGVKGSLPGEFPGQLSHLLVQPDGRILIFGGFTEVQGTERRCLARLLANGDLDGSYQPDISGTSVDAAVLQPDGRLLIAGDFQAVSGIGRAGVARLHPDGMLDPSFDPSDIPFAGGMLALALESAGKVLVGGRSFDTTDATSVYLARLNSDGSQDHSFDAHAGVHERVWSLAPLPEGQALVNGTRRLHHDGTTDDTFCPPPWVHGCIWAVLVQPDGRILLGGRFQPEAGTSALGVVRLRPDGSLDSIWQDTRLEYYGQVRALLAQPDGQTLAAGYFTSLNGVPRTLIARLDADGRLDPSFEPSIYVYPETDEGDLIAALALQGPDRVLVAGYLRELNGFERHSLARLYTSQGGCPGVLAFSADRYFFNEAERQAVLEVVRRGDTGQALSVHYATVGQDPLALSAATPELDFTLSEGVVTFAAGESVKTITVPLVEDALVEPSERFFVTLSDPTDGGTLGGITLAIVTIVDQQSAGQPGNVDRGFHPILEGRGLGLGVTGIHPLPDGRILIHGDLSRVNGQPCWGLTRLTADGGWDGFAPEIVGLVKVVVPLSNGQVLVGGDLVSVEGWARRGLARLNADGSLDAAFDAKLDGEVKALLVEPDGRIVMGGEFDHVNGTVGRARLARLSAEGLVDLSFDPGRGPRWSDFTGDVSSLARQADGKLLVGGGFVQFDGVERLRLVRLSSNGSVDPTFDVGPGLILTGLPSVTVQPDGKLLIYGPMAFRAGPRNTSLARVNEDGSLDPGFVTAQSYEYVTAAALQADSKILIGGSFCLEAGGRPPVGVARLNPGGSLDPGFGVGLGAEYGVVLSLAVLANGDVLVGGVFETMNGFPHRYLARLMGGVGDGGGPGPLAWQWEALDQRLTFRWRGQPGQLFQVEMSPDLTRWTALARITCVDDTAEFVEEGVGAHASRFYRVRRVDN